MEVKNPYGSILAAEIRAFLEFWPGFQDEAEEMRRDIEKDQHLFFTDKTPPLSWCHLYELPAELVRQGDDKALFKAIRIDPTCLGCKPIVQRISKATMTQDKAFFKELRRSIGHKPESLAQSNFQKMRLVLEVLHESGADKLNDRELEHLFIEQLNLYAANKAGGGSRDSLRKFVNTHMRQKSRT